MSSHRSNEVPWVPDVPINKGRVRAVRSLESKQAMARSMREFPTQHEAILAAMLVQMGVHKEFKQQEILFGYIADFWHSGFRGPNRGTCAPFIIEVDGDTHTTKGAVRWDKRRDEVFAKNGIKVIRVTHAALRFKPGLVKQVIASALLAQENTDHERITSQSGRKSDGGITRPVRRDVGADGGKGRGSKG